MGRAPGLRSVMHSAFSPEPHASCLTQQGDLTCDSRAKAPVRRPTVGAAYRPTLSWASQFCGNNLLLVKTKRLLRSQPLKKKPPGRSHLLVHFPIFSDIQDLGLAPKSLRSGWPSLGGARWACVNQRVGTPQGEGFWSTCL